MPWLIWQKFGYQNHKIILRTVVPISPAGGRRKVFDTESVRQGKCSTISGVVRLGFVGQLPCRTTSCISPGVIRVKFQLFDVLSKKAGLGPEPEFALLCRSFFRWSRLVKRRPAYLHCLYCLFFRWRSWYCCAGRLASPSVTRRARPEPL